MAIWLIRWILPIGGVASETGLFFHVLVFSSGNIFIAHKVYKFPYSGPVHGISGQNIVLSDLTDPLKLGLF